MTGRAMGIAAVALLLGASAGQAQDHRVGFTGYLGSAAYSDLAMDAGTPVLLAPGGFAGAQAELWFGRLGLRLNGGYASASLDDDPDTGFSLMAGDVDVVARLRSPRAGLFFQPYAVLGGGAIRYELGSESTEVGGESYASDPTTRGTVVLGIGTDLGSGPLALRFEIMDIIGVSSPLSRADGSTYGPVQHVVVTFGLSIRSGSIGLPPAPPRSPRPSSPSRPRVGPPSAPPPAAMPPEPEDPEPEEVTPRQRPPTLPDAPPRGSLPPKNPTPPPDAEPRVPTVPAPPASPRPPRDSMLPPVEPPSEPPADTTPEPPADTTPEPPADTTPEPPVDTTPEPPADTTPAQPPVEPPPPPPADTAPVAPPVEEGPFWTRGRLFTVRLSWNPEREDEAQRAAEVAKALRAAGLPVWASGDPESGREASQRVAALRNAAAARALGEHVAEAYGLEWEWVHIDKDERVTVRAVEASHAFVEGLETKARGRGRGGSD